MHSQAGGSEWDLESLLAGTSLLVGEGEVVVATDEGRRVLWVSPSVTTAFGWTREEFQAVCTELIHPDDVTVRDAMSDRIRAEPGVQHSGIARHRSRDGTWLWLEVIAVNLLEHHGIVLARFRDVTGTKQAERALVDLTLDDLTGLVTRRVLRRTLEERLVTGPAVGVLFCDLDGFKSVNDQHGHDEGDRLLRSLGERLRRWQTATDTLVGRWGGDEFVALAEVSKVGVDELVIDLTRAVGGFDSGSGLTASVGAALGRPGDDATDVIRQADEAMYRVKRDRRARRGEHR